MEKLELAPILVDPKTFLYEHCVLPTLPKVLSRFQEAMQQKDVSINRIVDVISSDPGIVAEILKVINSAYYNLPREVSRLNMAVAYLGINEVQNIVLTASVMNTFRVDEPREFKRLWHHSLYTALCARHLANQFERHVSYGELWAPALLHDIGKLVYLKFFPEHYIALRRFAEIEGWLFNEVVRCHGLPSSTYFGALLCERWRLPKTVKEICEVQGPDALKQGRNGTGLKPLHRVVVLGDLIAVLATDNLEQEKQLALSNLIMEELGLDESGFLMLMGAATDLKMEADRLAA